MDQENIQLVRIYLTEQKADLKSLLAHLHDVEKVRGVTVFRGICGFGQSGEMHSSSLLDLSLNLPIIIEFFDEPEKVDKILEYLRHSIKPGHIISWSATLS